jgi:hypothetical protein
MLQPRVGWTAGRLWRFRSGFSNGQIDARFGYHRQPVSDSIRLEHDPEKWAAVFRKDHAQTKK